MRSETAKSPFCSGRTAQESLRSSNVAGLLRFEGAITLDGFPNKSLEAKRLLGYIPEMPAVYDLLTVAEHLSLSAARTAWRTTAMTRRFGTF